MTDSTPSCPLTFTLPQPSHLDALTGLRAIAAYSVLIAHAINSAFIYGGVLHFNLFASRLAYFGMSLFFVLSGFVIHYNYAESFARERLAVASWLFSPHALPDYIHYMPSASSSLYLISRRPISLASLMWCCPMSL